MDFEQQSQLEALIKLRMRYNEEIISCANCRHSTYDDYVIYCVFPNPIHSFKTKETASCKFFEAKPKE